MYFYPLMVPYTVFTLSNGIRVLHQPADGTDIAHCCLFINAGSRDEGPDKPGLAHFIEHLLFKGTKRRNAYHILNRLEVVGADLNAYTTKEQTCIHASFLIKHAERVLELLTDIMFHSTFPESELQKEKGVILDEIESYRETPDEYIQDHFDELVFKGHALANNILGTPESVRKFTRDDISTFIAESYAFEHTVLGFYGNIQPAKLVKLAEKYLEGVSMKQKPDARIPVPPYEPGSFVLKRNFIQAHAVIGNRAYNIHDHRKNAMLLLNNLLGGPGMNSRLNLEIREKHGIAYQIESNYMPMSDTGLFTVYLATDPEKIAKSLSLVHRELKKVCTTKLGTVQLHQAKQKFIGQIALAEENRQAVIQSMAKSLLDHGYVDSLQEIFEKIEAVSAEQIMDAANDIFNKDMLSMLIFNPREI